jgi:hypothetical protein
MTVNSMKQKSQDFLSQLRPRILLRFPLPVGNIQILPTPLTGRAGVVMGLRVTTRPEMEFIHFNKRLESFAPRYSQSLLLADFKENPTLFWF